MREEVPLHDVHVVEALERALPRPDERAVTVDQQDGREHRVEDSARWAQVLRSVSLQATPGESVHVSACRRSWTTPPSATG